MLAAYLCPELQSSMSGRDVIHFADNQPANGAARKAYSASRDLAAIVRRMHEAWDELDVDPWIEYVRSENNLADCPSRGRLTEMWQMGATRVSFVAPALP